MPTLSGHFETEHASKYLQQLCKHFAHKVDATYDTQHGTVQFIFGPAELNAEPDALRVSFALKDLEAVGPAKHVIDSHLKKFAFRENFEAMTWQEPQT